MEIVITELQIMLHYLGIRMNNWFSDSLLVTLTISSLYILNLTQFYGGRLKLYFNFENFTVSQIWSYMVAACFLFCYWGNN